MAQRFMEFSFLIIKRSLRLCVLVVRTIKIFLGINKSTAIVEIFK